MERPLPETLIGRLSLSICSLAELSRVGKELIPARSGRIAAEPGRPAQSGGCAESILQHRRFSETSAKAAHRARAAGGMKFGALLRETAGEEPDLQALFTCARGPRRFSVPRAPYTTPRRDRSTHICVSTSHAMRAASSVLSARFWHALNARHSTAVHFDRRDGRRARYRVNSVARGVEQRSDGAAACA